MLESFFQPPAHFKVAEPWMWETPVSPREEALLVRAVESRKQEFRAGRQAARALFRQLGVDYADLLRGVQREPAWPPGWVGSISHTQGLCMVMLASERDALGVGLDVEQATPLNQELVDLICLPEEQAQLRALQGDAKVPAACDKLVFSAKESVHKVYFPLNHHTLDFLDARIDLDWAAGTFTASILKPEAQPRVPVRHMQGRFLFYRDWILTSILLPAVSV